MTIEQEKCPDCGLPRPAHYWDDPDEFCFATGTVDRCQPKTIERLRREESKVQMTTMPSNMKPTRLQCALAIYQGMLASDAGPRDIWRQSYWLDLPAQAMALAFERADQMLALDEQRAAGPELVPCPGCGELFQPNDGIGGDACYQCCAAPSYRRLREENTRLRKTIEALRSRQAGLLRGREELAQVLREKAR